MDAGAPAITSTFQPAGRRKRQGRRPLFSVGNIFQEVHVQLCLNFLDRKALLWPHPDTGDGKCGPHLGQLGIEGLGTCAGAGISSCYGAPGSRCLSRRGLGGSHVKPLVVDFSNPGSALQSRKSSCLADKHVITEHLITACAVRWSVPDQPPDQCVHSPLISACQSLITA